MTLPHIRLKKGEDRRIRAGHPWIFSNEVDTVATPLKSFTPGEEVIVEAQDKSLLGVAYVNPHSLISARVFSQNPRLRLDESFFIQQMNLALALRSRLFDKPYYRLIFGEADNLPGLVIDRFANDFVVQINTAGMDQKKVEIAQALRSVFPDLHSILLRNDSQMREHEGLEQEVAPLFGNPPEVMTLEENGVSFSIPFWKGQKTGWFYDHRMNRARLKEYVKGKSVLDVFSYVGGWGIQAAAFGASSVECIETSASACEFINKNALLNKLETPVKTICDDAFDALKELVQKNKKYDIIILDPPAFVKKSKDLKAGLTAYQRLNELALKLLQPDGILFSCSCSMHVGIGEFIQIIQRAALKSNAHIQILERGHQGPDHPLHIAIPETDYLKAVIVRKIA